MKSFRAIYAIIFFVLVSVLPTGGQSLVMSGNEIFEQEVIPSKKRKETSKKVEEKSLKQKGAVRVPVFSPKTTEKDQSNKIEKSKPAVTTYSYEQRDYNLRVILQVLFVLLTSLA